LGLIGGKTVGLSACCAAVLLTMLGLLAGPSDAAGRGCGQIARIGEFGAELVSVRAKGVSCRTARRVLSHPRSAGRRGWECHSAGVEASCTKGAARATYGPTRFRRCGSLSFAPTSDYGTGKIVAKRVRCGAARAVARASRDRGSSVDPPAYRARGFRCTGKETQDTLRSALYTCRRKGATVAFERF